MKVDVPIQVLPQLFFEVGLLKEEDKNILMVHLNHDSSAGFHAHLCALGFDFGEQTLPDTCEGLLFNLDLPDSLIEASKETAKHSQCKSIW